MTHVHMPPAQHIFQSHCLTASSPAAVRSASASTSTSPSSNNSSVPNQESAQRYMAMLSQELSSVPDRDVPSQAEAGAASAQGRIPYATPSQSTHINIMVARTIRAAIAEVKANSSNQHHHHNNKNNNHNNT